MIYGGKKQLKSGFHNFTEKYNRLFSTNILQMEVTVTLFMMNIMCPKILPWGPPLSKV